MQYGWLHHIAQIFKVLHAVGQAFALRHLVLVLFLKQSQLLLQSELRLLRLLRLCRELGNPALQIVLRQKERLLLVLGLQKKLVPVDFLLLEREQPVDVLSEVLHGVVERDTFALQLDDVVDDVLALVSAHPRRVVHSLLHAVRQLLHVLAYNILCKNKYKECLLYQML